MLYRQLQNSVAKLSTRVGGQIFFIKFPRNAYKHIILSNDNGFFSDSKDIHILIYGLVSLEENIILFL
jgi:hypothetical protein